MTSQEPLFAESASERLTPRPFQSPEVKRLLNPAFCSIVLWRFSSAFGRATSPDRTSRFPSLHVSYLVLPLALHLETQSLVLSHNTSFGLHRFVRNHPQALVELPNRVEGYVEITNQAILFGCLYGALGLNDRGYVTAAGKYSNARLGRALGLDELSAVRAASRLGSWFTQLSDPEIFIHLCIST